VNSKFMSGYADNCLRVMKCDLSSKEIEKPSEALVEPPGPPCLSLEDRIDDFS
jgi:hypothetical protein